MLPKALSGMVIIMNFFVRSMYVQVGTICLSSEDSVLREKSGAAALAKVENPLQTRTETTKYIWVQIKKSWRN